MTSSVTPREHIRQTATEQGWQIRFDTPGEIHLIRSGGHTVLVWFSKRGGITDTVFGDHRYRTKGDRLAMVLRWLRDFGTHPAEHTVRVTVVGPEIIPGDQVTNGFGRRVRVVSRAYDNVWRQHILTCTRLNGEPTAGYNLGAGKSTQVWREA